MNHVMQWQELFLIGWLHTNSASIFAERLGLYQNFEFYSILLEEKYVIVLKNVPTLSWWCTKFLSVISFPVLVIFLSHDNIKMASLHVGYTPCWLRLHISASTSPASNLKH